VCTGDGRLIAADAKVVLDDDAVHRHPGRSVPIAWKTDSSFMQRCRELGVMGVDNRTALRGGKNVSLLGNGAGLTMATYDQVALSGVGVAGAIELHGALAKGVAHTAEVIRALFMLEADVVFINAFYQLRSRRAGALLKALESPGAPARAGRDVMRVNETRSACWKRGLFYASLAPRPRASRPREMTISWRIRESSSRASPARPGACSPRRWWPTARRSWAA
jgi:hypothetical protein